MKITEVLVPSLLTGGANIIAESVVETIPQRSSDDLLAGDQVATAFGEIADHLGMDGNELVRDLKRGDNLRGQTLVAVVGFIQNYAINLSVDRVLKYFTPVVKQGVEKLKQLRGSRPSLPRTPNLVYQDREGFLLLVRPVL